MLHLLSPDPGSLGSITHEKAINFTFPWGAAHYVLWWSTYDGWEIRLRVWHSLYKITKLHCIWLTTSGSQNDHWSSTRTMWRIEHCDYSTLYVAFLIQIKISRHLDILYNVDFKWTYHTWDRLQSWRQNHPTMSPLWHLNPRQGKPLLASSSLHIHTQWPST